MNAYNIIRLLRTELLEKEQPVPKLHIRKEDYSRDWQAVMVLPKTKRKRRTYPKGTLPF